MRHALPAAALALALASCDTGFDPQYLVKDLRILGLRAQVEGSGSADASLGDVVRVEALVVDPLDRQGLTVTWYGCLPAATESLPPCADPEYLADPARLAAEAAAPEPRVLALGSCQPSGDRCGIAVPVPDVPVVRDALAFVLRIAVEDPAFSCRPYAEMPVVAVAEAEGRRQIALKRVRIVPPPEDLAAAGLADVYVVNLGPRALEVNRVLGSPSCAQGTPVTAPFPQGETVLCALADASLLQRFNVCGPNGERDLVAEDLSWQWYATGGEFPEFDGIGNATGSPVDFARPAGPFTLWTILRDGRGGEDWLRRDVGAAP